MNHRKSVVSSNCRLLYGILIASFVIGNSSWADTGRPIVRPVSATETAANPTDDPQYQADLTALRDQYQQDRQALKAKSAQLTPEERLRLHKELLEAHRAALIKLDEQSRSRSQGSREKWEKRKEQRVERLEEARKDGTARKRHQDDREGH